MFIGVFMYNEIDRQVRALERTVLFLKPDFDSIIIKYWYGIDTKWVDINAICVRINCVGRNLLRGRKWQETS